MRILYNFKKAKEREREKKGKKINDYKIILIN